MMTQFKREVRPYLNSMPESELALMAIGQHNNLPTRLLDWTESPLVGIYFAVSESGVVGKENKNAAVYVVSPPDEILGPVEEQAAYESTSGPIRIYRPPHLHPRIVAQKGLFTFHPDPRVTFTSAEIRKWIIPSELCFRFRVELDKWGINHAVLFPDLGGLCTHLGWAHRRQRLS